MNIFDAHVSGSLSVSGSGEISNDLLISGNLTVLGLISGSISGSITNANTASEAPKYTLTSSFNNFTASHNTGSFTGSFIGDGSDLYNIPASGVTGLELNKVTDGEVNATISAASGFKINTNTEITGTLKVTGNIVGAADFTSLRNLPTLVSGSDQLTSSLDSHYVISGSITQTTWDNIASKPNGIVSGSVQVELTGTTGYSTFSSSVSSSIGSLSSSVDVTTSGLSSSIGSLSSSVATTTSGLSSSMGLMSSSIATTTSGLSSSIGELSSSIATTDSNQNGRLSNLETSTGSLNSFTSSINTTIKNKMNSDGVLSGSITFDISTIPGFSGLTETVSSSISSSVNQLSGSLTVTVTNLSSSLTNTDESQNARIVNLETASGSLNSFTSSINTTIKNKMNNDGVLSGSVQVNITGTTGYSTFSSSIATTTSGLSSSIGGLSSSIATTDFNQDSKLTSIENKTGSYATTGSNKFIGDQTITGSLIVTQNLQVLGSSSFVYVTSSQLNVSSSTISVNVFEPAERFGGLKIYDSGSSTATASFLWDSLNNRFVYQNVTGALYNGAMFIAGPRNSGSLGDEPTLTSGKIPKSVGGDHIDNSIISEISGNTIAISGSLVITGSILSTTTPIVSGSSQIDHNTTTNYVANQHIDHTTVSITAGDGISGGGTIASTRTITLDTGSAHFNGGVKTKLNAEGVISGSSQILAGTTIHSGAFFNGISVVSGSGQISFNGITDKPALVSGSAQVSFTGITDKPTLVSGSSQIIFGSISSLPTLVSGSSQITISSTTGYVANEHINHTGVTITAGLGMSGGGDITTTRTITLDTGSAHFQNGIKTYLNAQTVVSSSAQVLSGTGIWSGSAQLPTGTVSGSSQITYGSISGIPSGIVSGSSQVLSGTTIHSGSFFNGITVVSGSGQIDFTGIINKPTLVSGSSQISYSGLTGIPSGIVSGSSQITFGSVTGVPSGLVSGSSQITLSATTGFGTYLNQAVLTTSNPTFNSVIASDHRSTGTGYITYDTDNAGTNSLIIRKYGTTVATFNSSGNSVFAGTISASNFSGTSSGTNTGDQTNISGNAATATSATSATSAGRLETTNNQWTWSQVAHTATNPNTITLWDQYSTNGGSGSPVTYGTIVDIYGRSSHEHDQLLMDSGGEIRHRNCFYGTNAWNGWRVMLDSTNYSSYALPLGGGTMSGAITMGGNSITVSLNSSAGYQNSNASAWFRPTDTSGNTHIYNNNSGGIYLDTNANHYFRNVSGTNRLVLDTSGNATLTGVFTENSSVRYKTNIETIKYGLDKVLQMRGVTYERKDNGKIEAGVIAEEMNEITPLVVLKNEEGEVDSVSYGRINAYLIEAIKDLKQELNEQNLIISELKRKLDL